MPSALSVTTERLPKSQVGMTIEVPAEMVDATYEKVLNRLASKAKLEGFRPGRAPRALVEARLGPAALREEVVETIVPEVIREALAEKSISPIDNPDVEVLELERGRPARLKATVTVMPQVKLGDAKALEVAAPSVEVTDEMLEKRLEDVREPMAEITPVDRAARMGDVVVIDVEVEAGGTVVPSESRQAMEAELKDGVLLPDLDDELARQLTDGKHETVEAYRSAVREQLAESAKQLAQMAREQALVKALVDASSVDVPDSLVERELASTSTRSTGA